MAHPYILFLLALIIFLLPVFHYAIHSKNEKIDFEDEDDEFDIDNSPRVVVMQ